MPGMCAQYCPLVCVNVCNVCFTARTGLNVEEQIIKSIIVKMYFKYILFYMNILFFIFVCFLLVCRYFSAPLVLKTPQLNTDVETLASSGGI